MIIPLREFRLEYRGEPVVEFDTVDKVIVTYFRGLECFPNYWPVDEVDVETRRKLTEILNRRLHRRRGGGSTMALIGTLGHGYQTPGACLPKYLRPVC